MFKKIITYLLIMSVIIPIFTSAPVGFGTSYGKDSNPIYDKNDNIIGYETTYKNKNGDTIVRRKYEGAEGGTGTITEEYMDKDGTVHRRMGNYENDGEYSSINWSESRGEFGDFKEYESRATESEYNKAIDEALEREQTGEVANPCAWWSRQTWSTCINYTINTFLYHVVFRMTNYITYLSGQLFNASIGFSLNGKTFDTDNNIMIAVGWQTIRDLVNMFFIFILLYIGISTILQYGNFGKAVLINAIVAAVLINFSMMITKVTIDASHVFAWEFYNRIDVVNSEKLGKGTTFTEIGSDIKVTRDFETKNLSAVFMAGFNPQRIMGKSSKSEAAYNDALKAALASGGGIGATWFQMNLIIILASIVNIVAAFILFAGTILFIVRIVVLWFVMIFSPVAFVGMVSPNLKGYSKQWWDHLIGQSFFAPAFLFMLALVAKLVNSGFLESTIFAAKNSASLSILKIDPASTVIIFFNFLIIGGLMSGSLIIAKKMGGSSASAAIGWAHKGKDWMMGFAGKTAKYGIGRPAGYGVGAGLDNLAGRINTGKGAFSQSLRALPGLGGWARGRSADVRERIKKKEEKFKGMTEQELKETQQAPEKALPFIKQISQLTRGVSKFFDSEKQAAAIQEMAKQKMDLTKNVSDKDIEAAKAKRKLYGERTKDIDILRADLVKGEQKDRDDYLRNLQAGNAQQQAQYQQIQQNLQSANAQLIQQASQQVQAGADDVAKNNVVKRIKVSDIENTGMKLFEPQAVGGLVHLTVKNFGSSHANKIVDFGGEREEKFMKALVSLRFNMPLPGGGTVPAQVMEAKEVAEALEQLGNSSLAGWALSPLGVKMVDAYGRKNIPGWRPTP